MKSKYGYKIGKSKDPKKRLRTFKTAAPDVKLIAYGNGVSESFLHSKYKNRRKMGEWFMLSPKEVESIIRSLKNEYSPEPDSKKYQQKLNYVIRFGKHKGKKMSMMTSYEELSYIKWFLRESESNESYTRKVFKWWLRQME